jgi:transcriptional regulator with XRE-family HTH domain
LDAKRAAILEQFGRKLRERREARPVRISQEALGRRAGLHRSEISFLERGLREPNLLTILGLAYALNTSPAELLDGLPLQPTPPRKSTARKQRGRGKKS